LDHENQRFRFSYVLGRHYRDRVADLEPGLAIDSFDDEDGETEAPFAAEPEGLPGIDLVESKRVVGWPRRSSRKSSIAFSGPTNDSTGSWIR
jgi:hypothetical protein